MHLSTSSKPSFTLKHSSSQQLSSYMGCNHKNHLINKNKYSFYTRFVILSVKQSKSHQLWFFNLRIAKVHYNSIIGQYIIYLIYTFTSNSKNSIQNSGWPWHQFIVYNHMPTWCPVLDSYHDFKSWIKHLHLNQISAITNFKICIEHSFDLGSKSITFFSLKLHCALYKG